MRIKNMTDMLTSSVSNFYCTAIQTLFGKTPNVTAEFLALLIRIREDTGSYLGILIAICHA